MSVYNNIKKWLNRPKHPYQKDVNRFPLIPAAVVFLTLLALIAFTWRSAQAAVEEDRRNKVTTFEAVVQNSLDRRLASYEEVLHGTSGLVSVNKPYPTKTNWETYINTLSLNERYTRIFAIGLAPVIPQAAAGEFSATAANLEVSNFTPAPLTNDPQIIPILYATSFRDKVPVTNPGSGFNLLSDPVRKAAVQNAIQTGDAKLTSQLVLSGENEQTAPPSALLYLPTYKPGADIQSSDQRIASVTAVSFIAFRLQALFEVDSEQSDSMYGYTVSSTKSGETGDVYRSPSLNKQGNNLLYEYTKDVEINGQNWNFSFYASNEVVPASIRARPSGIIIGGLIFSLSIATSVYLLIRRRILDQAYLEEIKVQTAKDDLLSLASHQLRTPATGVKQYIGMVLQGYVGKIDPEQEKMLTMAYESNERQLRIINEFLYMAKADAGRIVVSTQEFDLTALVKTIIKEQASEAKQAQVKLTQRLASNVIVVGDTHSITMVIENLLSNAIKYTPAGGKVSVRLRISEQEATLDVEDTGVGIDKKDLHLLFKQFSRVPNELTQSVSGSGIGLYLAQHLMELNDGNITVESSPGSGSTFTVKFKLAPAEDNVFNNTESGR